MNKKLPSSNDKKPMADSVDVHFLYEKSVQNVVHEIDFMRRIYIEKRGKNAKIYREDFCGTANSKFWLGLVGILQSQGEMLYAK